MSNRLKNKIAVITGGTSGIGLSTAKEFARQGAQIVLLARSREKLDKAIVDIGHNATGYIGDVGDLNSLASFYDNVAKDIGKIDIVFASAGVVSSTMLEDTDDETFSQISDINFKNAIFIIFNCSSLFSLIVSIFLNLLVLNCCSEYECNFL